jgi:hypothetical protein
MAKGKKTGGRKKNTPNKTTSAVKEALSLAFDKVGGVASLAAWARDNQTEFYKLWVKMLPQELQHSDPDGQPLTFTIRLGDAGDSE